MTQKNNFRIALNTDLLYENLTIYQVARIRLGFMCVHVLSLRLSMYWSISKLRLQYFLHKTLLLALLHIDIVAVLF